MRSKHSLAAGRRTSRFGMSEHCLRPDGRPFCGRGHAAGLRSRGLIEISAVQPSVNGDGAASLSKVGDKCVPSLESAESRVR